MTKYQGWKAVLSYNTTGTTYVDIGQVMEIGDIGSTRGLIDVSAYGDEWSDFLGGRQEGTEFTIRVALDPADTTLDDIKDNYDTGGNAKKYHVEHPDIAGRGLEFTAIQTGYLERASQDTAWEVEITYKIVEPGVVTFVPA